MNKSYEIMCYLRDHHKGEDKAILSSNLERLFDLDGRSLRRKISELRDNGYRICSGPHGYYYAGNIEEYWKYLSWHTSIITPKEELPFDDVWEEYNEPEDGESLAGRYCICDCGHMNSSPCLTAAPDAVFVRMIFNNCEFYGG